MWALNRTEILLSPSFHTQHDIKGERFELFKRSGDIRSWEVILRQARLILKLESSNNLQRNAINEDKHCINGDKVSEEFKNSSNA